MSSIWGEPERPINRIAYTALLLAVAVVFVAQPLRAHHGPPVAPLYNTDGLLELDGEIVQVFWRNPHVRFKVRVSDGEVWELETEPVGMLARRGIGPELLKIGDSVSVAEIARAARADFDSLTDEPILNCVPDGMPRAMLHPTPIEFQDEGDRILMRIHEHDLVRTIYMSGAASAAAQPATPLGYSVGRWEGEALVVTTTRVSWPFSDEVGTPQTDAVELVERFTISEDQSRLNYEFTATDRAVLLRPSVRAAHWMWVSGVEIEPFECTLWEGIEE